MTAWKLPPRAKVFEAFSAVADGRVRLTGPGSATVTSSGGDKTYDVEWSEDGRTIAANDNASYWQGYLGYPALAVLLERGELRAGEDVGPGARRRPLARPQQAVQARLRRGGRARARRPAAPAARTPARSRRAVDDVMGQLAALDLQRAGRGRRPPK